MKFEIDKTYVDKLASHNGDFKNLPFAVDLNNGRDKILIKVVPFWFFRGQSRSAVSLTRVDLRSSSYLIQSMGVSLLSSKRIARNCSNFLAPMNIIMAFTNSMGGTVIYPI